MRIEQLKSFLDNIYQSDGIEDYCHNGLVVEGNKKEINNIALGVSLSKQFIERAIAKKADVIIVHHAYFGKNFFVLKGREKRQVELLLDNGISLFSFHLPMDCQASHGHNAVIGRELGLKNREPFFPGFISLNQKDFTIENMIEKLSTVLEVEKKEPVLLSKDYNLYKAGDFLFTKNHPTIPYRIAIISGGAASEYTKALEAGADTFITGEIKESSLAISVETKSNFVALGHYNSEKAGIIELEKILITKLGLNSFFIDIPNPL